MTLQMSYKHYLLLFNILQLSNQGHTQTEIATILHVTQSTINKDLAYLRNQALENLQHHIHEKIPEEYQRCMIGMKLKLKETLEIAESTSDPKVKLQDRAIANDCYKYIMDLTTNGVVITDALKYVQGKLDNLNNQEKKLLQDIKEEKEDTEYVDVDPQTETQTHNGIF